MTFAASSSNDSPSISPPPRKRLRYQLLQLTPAQRADFVNSLPAAALLPFLYDWSGIWARDSQLLPEGDWSTWLVCAGRSFGKTHCGAESVIEMQRRGAGRIALVAPTSADARDVMLEGKSGIITLAPPWNRPKYEPSKRRLSWSNGARAFLYSAEEPERLRGPQHDFAWCDEIAAWTNGEEVWNQLQFGMRVGDRPRAIATTTPKAVPLVLKLMADPRTVTTRGNTFENTALPESYLQAMHRLFDGTRLGRQEIHAEVLTDNPGALFSQEIVDANRVREVPPLSRIIISIDPAPTSDRGSDETGIMATGKDDRGHGYVLKDHSLRGSPDEWARAAVKAYYEHRADMIVAEVNNGGEMVEAVLRSVDENVPFKAVRAMRGKSKRAEPVAALYEQGKIHHVGDLEKLEKQMRVFTGVNGRRDDRTDAMCWGLHELLIDTGEFVFV